MKTYAKRFICCIHLLSIPFFVSARVMPALFLCACFFWGGIGAGSSFGASPEADCMIDRGPCVKKAENLEISLDIAPRPVKAMKELTFTVTVRGNEASDSLVLDLGMPGMYMGNNRPSMKKNTRDSFTGTGVIPKCPSGRTLWRATVEVPGKGKTEFLFDVAY